MPASLALAVFPSPPGGADNRGPGLRGTPGSETFVGAPGNDAFYGYGGRDSIDGRGGRDIVYGGPGTDLIMGGTDSDWLAATREAGGAGLA
jgi:Ca2+-binding RTX toxin-like protein